MDSSRRQKEWKYWDSVARVGTVGAGGKSMMTDNVDKRGLIVGHLLSACGFAKERILEIGVGGGITAASLKLITLREWDYVCTDMSLVWVEYVKDQWGLNAFHTDILHLPGKDGHFSRVMALDTLEHVHPDDRAGGYKEIARVTASAGLLLINMPLDEDKYSHHDKEFDHRFGLDDLHQIEMVGFQLKSYKRYFTGGEQPRPLAFVVMERR